MMHTVIVIVVRVRVPVIMVNQVRAIVVSRVHVGRPPIAVVTVKRARTTGWRSRVTGRGTPLPNVISQMGAQSSATRLRLRDLLLCRNSRRSGHGRPFRGPGASVRQTVPKPRPAADAIGRDRRANPLGGCRRALRTHVAGRRLAALLIQCATAVLVQPSDQAPSSGRRTVRRLSRCCSRIPLLRRRLCFSRGSGDSFGPVRHRGLLRYGRLWRRALCRFLSPLGHPLHAATPGSLTTRRTISQIAACWSRPNRSLQAFVPARWRNSVLLAAAWLQSSSKTPEPACCRALPLPSSDWNFRSALDLRFSTNSERAWNLRKADSAATASRVVGWPCDPPWTAARSCFARRHWATIAQALGSAMLHCQSGCQRYRFEQTVTISHWGNYGSPG